MHAPSVPVAWLTSVGPGEAPGAHLRGGTDIRPTCSHPGALASLTGLPSLATSSFPQKRNTF